MIDATTQRPIRVTKYGEGEAFISVPLTRLDEVRDLLRRNDVRHWVGDYGISIDGQPPRVIISLGSKIDPAPVQALLDGAE